MDGYPSLTWYPLPGPGGVRRGQAGELGGRHRVSWRRRPRDEISFVGSAMAARRRRRILTRHDRSAEHSASATGPRPDRGLVRGEWVAHCLEELGHEVVVADPNFAPIYTTRRPPGEDGPPGRSSADGSSGSAPTARRTPAEPQRRCEPCCRARDLVRTRVPRIQVVRALSAREGLRVRSGQASSSASTWTDRNAAVVARHHRASGRDG